MDYDPRLRCAHPRTVRLATRALATAHPPNWIQTNFTTRRRAKPAGLIESCTQGIWAPPQTPVQKGVWGRKPPAGFGRSPNRRRPPLATPLHKIPKFVTWYNFLEFLSQNPCVSLSLLFRYPPVLRNFPSNIICDKVDLRHSMLGSGYAKLKKSTRVIRHEIDLFLDNHSISHTEVS